MEYVQAIRDKADESNSIRSPDPVAFISVFATVLCHLVPMDAVERHKDDIHEVMGEMVGIIKDVDAQPWAVSRMKCFQEIGDRFWQLYLEQAFSEASHVPLYLKFIQLHSKAYNSKRNCNPFSHHTLLAFIHHIQRDPTMAAFSLLTMYSIRHRTLTDYPDAFDILFENLLDREKPEEGKLSSNSPSHLQLIEIHRGPIATKSTRRNKISHPFHLESTTRRFG